MHGCPERCPGNTVMRERSALLSPTIFFIMPCLVGTYSGCLLLRIKASSGDRLFALVSWTSWTVLLGLEMKIWPVNREM